MTIQNTKEAVHARAREMGFDAVGFTAPQLSPRVKEDFTAFIKQGLHGDMVWMAEKAAQRRDPASLLNGAKTVIVLGINYGATKPLLDDPLSGLHNRDRGNLSVYARGSDYHHVVKKRLKAFASWLCDTHSCDARVYVDTSPVLEKPLAAKTPVGWQGKHTNLVSRDYGSWLFLGEVLTTLDLPSDVPEEDHCGSCRDCLDICPTEAFSAPYRIDAKRCISYLTIEHKGPISREFRTALSNRIFGCDDCLAVCPWNKYARESHETALLPRPELTAPRLATLAALDDAAFRDMFAGTAVKRLGRTRFIRNVLIALGNSGENSNSSDPNLVSATQPHLDDPEPVVRGAAVWALSQLLDKKDFTRLRERHLAHETDPEVREEWECR
ncbi:MAG: tRNA epoxyqueuosine(34) reductase QueG [Alphaproteobacteria bacterium]|jgi:epoxyqueuosine reductase|nr:tRNA epoxyqueuosine(34) reductase QueG [Alphaproteobacteria bacterium]MDP6661020.1 tRNA epoxyqueuosine(34) reductase QueG [Alphaproteobacteria bacterium]MDP6780258.1 tRNA epoxyqueuosine(34) reductase QueG [Alphaproteobacteria bacterium]